MKLAKQSLVVLFALNLSACATLFQGGPDKIPVSSEPSGARVLLNGVVTCNTPCVLSISHNQDANIAIEKNGYERVQINRGKVLSGAFVADIISLAGGIIDLATSNQGHYPEDPISVSLQKN